MARGLNVDFSNSGSIREWLENSHEKYYMELKKSASSLPSDFWPSYSAFANTEGGWIVLGVLEDLEKMKSVA